MPKHNLKKKATIELSVSHLLVVWDILANKLSGAPILDEFTEEERRAVWALQDLCEKRLGEIGVSPRPKPEWEMLMETAKKHIKTIPVEFLD